MLTIFLFILLLVVGGFLLMREWQIRTIKRELMDIIGNLDEAKENYPTLQQVAISKENENT